MSLLNVIIWLKLSSLYMCLQFWSKWNWLNKCKNKLHWVFARRALASQNSFSFLPHLSSSSQTSAQCSIISLSGNPTQFSRIAERCIGKIYFSIMHSCRDKFLLFKYSSWLHFHISLCTVWSLSISHPRLWITRSLPSLQLFHGWGTKWEKLN
jgi:hypothetical protein